MEADDILSEEVRIAVVGSGAVGGYYGAKLAAAGADVHFLMRADLEAVRDGGLKVWSECHGDVHLEGVRAYEGTDEIGPVDLVIVAIKTTTNDDLPDLLAPLLMEGTMILTLQNGLGADEFLAERYGHGQVLGGLCFVCLNRVAPGEIRHIGEGQIHLGEFGGEAQGRTHALGEAFRRAGVACVVTDRLAAARWKKLVWNVPFNGLSVAAGGIDVGQILADEKLLERTRVLMGEVIEAAGKLGYELRPSLVDEQIDVTYGMGAYRPSSLIDFEEGREVEVESIWGEPLRRGREAGVAMEALGRLYEEILERVNERDGQKS
ncbi:MAG: 2-dehydropantoate 2-reductase [Verrucomicrobiota bacterium]